jgi:murein L,D-transpeptidase YcbB/YkuD
MPRLKIALLFIAFNICHCYANLSEEANIMPLHQDAAIDSLAIESFFAGYSKLDKYKPQVTELYLKHNYNYIWFDSSGLSDFAYVIYNQVKNINDEGLSIKLPYSDKFESIFSGENIATDPEAELMISSVYILYITKVYGGIDIEKSKQTGWYLPRERLCYDVYLDSLFEGAALFKNERLFSQYYNLRKSLEKYRKIEQEGGWATIAFDKKMKPLKPGDTSSIVLQVRTRLFKEGFLNNDSGSNLFDPELSHAVTAYKKRLFRQPEAVITPALLEELNISVADRIKTISVNMERCRWISPQISNAKEIIAVNIPSYRLHYMRDGEPVLISRVVVGKEATKTIVFNGEISYLVFSPYWNVPNSILEKEILPALKKNPAYLEEHNMEWNGKRVRQRPGEDNALGLVKFMFPNSNDIYLHDTPAKSLFNKEERAFSHGCIRVEKARELALAITGKEGKWNEDKVDEAMYSGKETIYKLKQRIPIYISYFTAWADEDGNVAFFEDIYKRDDKLANLLFEL